MATTLTVTILRDPANPGQLKVSNSALETKPAKNHAVCWTCGVGEFAVLFKNDRSPFKNGAKALAANSGDTTPARLIRNLTSGEKGFPKGDPLNGATFPYGVAVLDATTNAIMTLDPDVIIDDPGGGGGPKKKKANAKKSGAKKGGARAKKSGTRR